MDKLSAEQRHKNMASIHSKDTNTLNHIWLQDRQTRITAYPQQNEEDMQMPMAAEGDVV